MSIENAIMELDTEIERLQSVRNLLSEAAYKAPANVRKAASTIAPKKRRSLSPEVKKRMAEAQKKRWAERRKQVK
jgi:hypothetical protein